MLEVAQVAVQVETTVLDGPESSRLSSLAVAPRNTRRVLVRETGLLE